MSRGATYRDTNGRQTKKVCGENELHQFSCNKEMESRTCKMSQKLLIASTYKAMTILAVLTIHSHQDFYRSYQEC
jgi:hypothetical protein